MSYDRTADEDPISPELQFLKYLRILMEKLVQVCIVYKITSYYRKNQVNNKKF